MRLGELTLTERATSVVYHYTSTMAALKILTSGNFELASTTGNRSEEQYAPKGRPFFLSLTRTPQGDYHRFVGTGAVLFKMDGDWFNSRYMVKPIDYWERAWLHSDGTRSREAEDRVFSAEPTIPITSITEVHVLLKEQDEFRSPRTRMLMFVAKKQGLPVFLYTDEAAWRLLDKRRAKSVKDAGDLLRGAQVPSGPSRKPTDYVKPWIELITKNDQAHLSDRAQRQLKTMRYYGRPDEDQNLSVDLSNARKPDAGDRASAVWLIKYMQANGFKTTLELKNSIEDKWNKIIDAQQRQEKVTEVFNQPYDATWEKSESGSYDALVPLPDGTNLSIMFNNEGNDEWQIEFYRNNSQAVTGAGDAQRVFATVLNSIQKFVKEHKPWRLMFSASKDVDPGQNSESRAKLYNKLVQRYASTWGYEEYAEDHGDQITYELTRIDSNIDAEIEEGWRDWAAGAAIGAAALGAQAGLHKSAPATPQQKPAVIQPQAQQVKGDAEYATKLVLQPQAKILIKTAQAAGMKGKELAQFIAQCAHETANFTSLKEFGGKLDFKKYDPVHNPRKAKILGNKKAGDGARYHGRGYIQLTGRDNYKRAGQALGLPLEAQPELVERPDVAAKVAVWFWQNRVTPNVTNFADTAAVTKPINSGLRGLEDRTEKYASIMALMQRPS